MMKWQDEHLGQYLTSGGREGHLFDFGPVNGSGIMPNCLIRHVGRKSGHRRVSPLIYGMVNGEIVLCASKGGAPTHPAWYLNIAAADRVDVQIGTQAYQANRREPEDAERQTVWDVMVAIYPPYAEYQEKTDRLIPLVLLKPVKPVPVFTAADIDD
ncbi:deazaflavin-dependent oxidoreductase, nitroreductase family [Sphingobium faniae]|nr:deazaflavin-dependent oxidoreductase, nitroreductase family [Sphingobium faniae]